MEQITHLEELSKLKFTEKEKKNFKDEFDTILDFVSDITKIDLDMVKENESGLNLSDFRKDEVKKSMKREEALYNAPETRDGCFVTPMVIE